MDRTSPPLASSAQLHMYHDTQTHAAAQSPPAPCSASLASVAAPSHHSKHHSHRHRRTHHAKHRETAQMLESMAAASTEPTQVQLPAQVARASRTFRVVIVGGSFAGIRAGQDLEAMCPADRVTITVVEKRDKYFYNLGALRAVVRPDLINLVWLPYDNIFKHPHNRVIQGEVAAVHPNSVLLADGRKLDFDSVLVATGSIYPPPCKADTTSSLTGKAEMTMFANKVRTAHVILIIGGGPTGVGLAAEIATEYPAKTVVLVHAGECLLSSTHSKSLAHKVHKRLKSMGVKIFLNERVEVPPNEPLTYRVECRWLKTSTGRMLFSDLQFLCNGIVFSTTIMDALDPAHTDRFIDARSGQIRVRPTMQIAHPHLPWIFSAGDVCNTEGEKQAYRADSQGAHVAKAMAKMAAAWARGDRHWHSVALKDWKDPAQYMSVVMGPKGGVTDTPWIVLGDLPTRVMKSKELFLARRYKEFNLPFPGIAPQHDVATALRDSNLISDSLGSGPRAASAIPTRLAGPRLHASNAAAAAAAAAADSLDLQYEFDRVSLSNQPLASKDPARHTHISPSDSECSSSCSCDSEDEITETIESKSMLYSQMLVDRCSQPSIATRSTASSGDPSTSLATVPSAQLSWLAQGPVLPRDAKKKPSMFTLAAARNPDRFRPSLAATTASFLN